MTQNIKKIFDEQGFVKIKGVLDYKLDLEPILNDMNFIMNRLVYRFVANLQLDELYPIRGLQSSHSSPKPPKTERQTDITIKIRKNLRNPRNPRKSKKSVRIRTDPYGRIRTRVPPYL